MVTQSILLNPVLWGVIGSAITGFIAYRTAAQKNTFDYSLQRESYVDKQLQELLISYKSDVADLKLEIRDLIIKNQQLVEEVFSLKAKIIGLEGRTNERNPC